MDLEIIRDFREKLRLLEREIGWQMKSDTECCGVTLAQSHIILEIGKNGESSVVDLSAALGLDTSTLSRQINGMVDAGLADRVLNPKDRRYVSITLTEEGQKAFRSIEDICNEKYARIFELIPGDRHVQVLEGFNLLVDAIVEARKTRDIFDCCRSAPSDKRLEVIS
jgi:DNA-binding MarR family transcriptional regulator